MTFDGWIDSIMREMLDVYKDALDKQAGVVAFIVSYNLMGGMVLLNVVMAILVESFTEAKTQVAVENERTAARDLLILPVSEPMEGLVKELASIQDRDALNVALDSIFNRMDVDRNHNLTLSELQEGLWNLSAEPRNQLSDEDFERYTHDRKMCNEHGRCVPHNVGSAWQRQASAS